MIAVYDDGHQTLDLGSSSKDNDDGGLDRDHISRRALSLRRRLLSADPAELIHEQVTVDTKQRAAMNKIMCTEKRPFVQ